MDSHRSQQLKQITEMSQCMLASAKEMDWDRVAELETQRKKLVTKCFQQLTNEQDAPEVAASIRAILRLNQEVTELGNQCRDQLGDEIHTHNTGRTATAAYLNCAR
jgi:hypothetical protein